MRSNTNKNAALVAVSATPKKSTVTRQTILDAAAKVFRERSFGDVRLSDIADAAGMQTGSLYYHFSSREELVDHVLVAGVDRVFTVTMARVNALPVGSSPREKLACAIEAHLEAMLETDDYVSATMRIINQVPRVMFSRRRKRQRAYLDYWRTLLEDGMADGALRAGIDISLCRTLLIGMLNSSIDWFRPGRLSAKEIAHRASDLICNGLMTPPQSAKPTRQPKRGSR